MNYRDFAEAVLSGKTLFNAHTGQTLTVNITTDDSVVNTSDISNMSNWSVSDPGFKLLDKLDRLEVVFYTGIGVWKVKDNYEVAIDQDYGDYMAMIGSFEVCDRSVRFYNMAGNEVSVDTSNYTVKQLIASS